jgi:sugar lactone lactonase YvrE
MRPFLSFSLSLLFFAVAGHSPARAGLIYVTLETAVVSFDISSGNSATIAGTKTTVVSGLTEAMGLVFDKDGYLYAVQYTPRLVSKIDITSKTTTTFATGFTDPRGITYNSATGNFYVANSSASAPGNTISLVSSVGSVSTYVSTGIRAPYGVALDGSGALYVANNGDASLTKVVAGVPSTLATFSTGSGTRGVAVSAAGDIYTTVGIGIQKTTSGGVTSTFVASGMGFPFGLAFDSSGKLFTASYTDNAIYAYDSFGTPLYSFSTGGGSSNRPRYVAFNTEGSGFNQTASAPIPEPGTWAAAGLLAGGALVARWRRRRKV